MITKLMGCICGYAVTGLVTFIATVCWVAVKLICMDIKRDLDAEDTDRLYDDYYLFLITRFKPYCQCFEQRKPSSLAQALLTPILCTILFAVAVDSWKEFESQYKKERP